LAMRRGIRLRKVGLRPELVHGEADTLL
jgi:hypothetical protein